MNQHFDCIIVGSGISGMSAAIYLKRANKNILLLESYIPGGQINKTSNVENYPGFVKIDGPSLVMNITDQITNLDIPLKYEEVLEIKKQNHFIVKTNKNEYSSDYVILATGRMPNKLGIDLEEEFIGKGISYCALCDGTLFKNKDVIVVGGGNSALEESIYLSKICRKITIINRGNALRASEILQEKVKQLNNITIKYNSKLNKINITDNKISSVIINNEQIACEGIFIYIGLTPKLDYLKNLNINLDKNYIQVDSNMKTNIDKLYACGDIIKKDVYQIITAASEGAIAATSVIKNMEEKDV